MKYQDLEDNSNLKDYCYQCLFSGGTWTKSKASKGDKQTVNCVFDAAKMTELQKSSDGANVEMTVDQDLTYKNMFDGLASCAGLVEDSNGKEASVKK
jgi:hypothetical protein